MIATNHTDIVADRVRPSALFRAAFDTTISIVDVDRRVQRFDLACDEGMRIPPHRFLAAEGVLGDDDTVARFVAPLTALQVDDLTVRPTRRNANLTTQLHRMTTLRALHIVGVGGPAISSLPIGLRDLEALSIDQCWLAGARTWKLVARFPKLRALSLQHSFGLIDEGIDALNALDGLERIDLSFTGLSPTALCALRMPMVSELGLRRVRVDEALRTHLVTRRRLQHIDLRWSTFEPTIEALPNNLGVRRTSPSITIESLRGSPPEAFGAIDGEDFVFRAYGSGWVFKTGDVRKYGRVTLPRMLTLADTEAILETIL